MPLIKDDLVPEEKLMSGYCPICDEEKIMLCNVPIAHCPDCGHHLNLRPVKED